MLFLFSVLAGNKSATKYKGSKSWQYRDKPLKTVFVNDQKWNKNM
jgi:hypothetical protein